MINCVPYGGICNRLKCMISCIANYKDINLIWQIPTFPGAVKTHFNDYFINKFNETSDDSLETIQSTGFIDEEMNQIRVLVDLNKEKQLKYLEVINSFETIPYITNEINDFKKKFTENMISFSVRTFTCFQREFDSIGNRFNINLLFEEMDKYDSNFFITCDSQLVFDKILERYSDKILYYPKRTYFGDLDSLEGAQDIIIDLYLAGLNKKLIGTMHSSFSESQWWFGGCESEYKIINLHD